jgi:hypothetical protein
MFSRVARLAVKMAMRFAFMNRSQTDTRQFEAGNDPFVVTKK